MNSTRTHVARIIATGFVVSLMFNTLLFWTHAALRKIGKQDLISRNNLSLSIALDLGDKTLSDPNEVVRAPRAYCEFRRNHLVKSDVFLDLLLGSAMWIVGYPQEPYAWQFEWDLTSDRIQAKWHAKQGLIVIEKGRTDPEGESAAPQVLYVGPEGFGESPDSVLGRFSDPQVACYEDPSTLYIYDTQLNAVFKIDFALQEVKSESWADKSIITASRAYFDKFDGLLQMHAEGASRWETDAEMEARLEKTEEPIEPYYVRHGLYPRETWEKDLESENHREPVPFGPRVHGADSNSDLWAMDDQGIFYLIDRTTLLLSGPKGQLPDCGKEKTHIPSQLLAYSALPLFVDGQYFGLMAASLSRDGSDAVMVQLDTKGRETDRSTYHLRPHHYRFGLATSSARTVLDFAQPLVFSVASSLWGPGTEAIAGHRSLFVWPLSMPARIAMDKTRKPGDRIGTLIMWNVLTWCVGLLLAIAVTKDLKQHGCSGKTQHAWLFACMGFGWIAVITYLITRPRTQFVTCTACGRTRRTDHTICQHCEADWAMCDLHVPDWRVTD